MKAVVVRECGLESSMIGGRYEACANGTFQDAWRAHARHLVWGLLRLSSQKSGTYDLEARRIQLAESEASWGISLNGLKKRVGCRSLDNNDEIEGVSRKE